MGAPSRVLRVASGRQAVRWGCVLLLHRCWPRCSDGQMAMLVEGQAGARWLDARLLRTLAGAALCV